MKFFVTICPAPKNSAQPGGDFQLAYILRKPHVNRFTPSMQEADGIFMLGVGKSNSRRGFTLIELLIVMAIIGLIAAILIPNLLDALQKAKQKRTMADMRGLGTGWFSWLTDVAQVGAAGAQTFDYSQLIESLTAEELLSTLYVNPTMFYVRKVPDNDGWGNPYDYAWSGNVSAELILGIRSFGRNLVSEGDVYSVGPFISTDYEQDIIWSDGLFIRYPSGARTQ